jgi:hypothetical protein
MFLRIPPNKLTNYYPPLYLQIFDGNAVPKSCRKKPNIKTKKGSPVHSLQRREIPFPRRFGRKQEEL